MSSQADTPTLVLQIDVRDSDSVSEINMMVADLQTELSAGGLEVMPITEDEQEIPTRSMDAVTLGALALAVLPVFTEKLIEGIAAWGKRHHNREVTVKVQVGDQTVEVKFNPNSTSPEEITRLINLLKPQDKPN